MLCWGDSQKALLLLQVLPLVLWARMMHSLGDGGHRTLPGLQICPDLSSYPLCGWSCSPPGYQNSLVRCSVVSLKLTRMSGPGFISPSLGCLQCGQHLVGISTFICEGKEGALCNWPGISAMASFDLMAGRQGCFREKANTRSTVSIIVGGASTGQSRDDRSASLKNVDVDIQSRLFQGKNPSSQLCG